MVPTSGEYCCSVTLIAVGDDLEPDEVTAALGWTPNKSWKRGERKRVTLPDGNEKVFDSFHEWGGWKLFASDEERERPFQFQVAALLDRLRDKKQALESLRDRGWEVELNCFVAASDFLCLPAAGGVGLAITFSTCQNAPSSQLGVSADNRDS